MSLVPTNEDTGKPIREIEVQPFEEPVPTEIPVEKPVEDPARQPEKVPA